MNIPQGLAGVKGVWGFAHAQLGPALYRNPLERDSKVMRTLAALEMGDTRELHCHPWAY